MSCTPRHRTVAAPRDDRPVEEARASQQALLARMQTRRTIRDFSARPVPFDLVETAIRTARTAPSGAHIQPWRFVVVSDRVRKRALRQAAEEEERAFYRTRASAEWLEALAPLGTDWRKPFLEEAPYVIVVMEVHKGPSSPRPYYPKESVGIAVGFLLASLHQAGLATLTHTPSPMRSVAAVLGRPREERPFVLVPVGYPAEDAQVPDLRRKPVDEVMVHLPGPSTAG